VWGRHFCPPILDWSAKFQGTLLGFAAPSRYFRNFVPTPKCLTIN
jgi:hypothetical protein